FAHLLFHSTATVNLSLSKLFFKNCGPLLVTLFDISWDIFAPLVPYFFAQVEVKPSGDNIPRFRVDISDRPHTYRICAITPILRRVPLRVLNKKVLVPGAGEMPF